jgi:hypothetical protein
MQYVLAAVEFDPLSPVIIDALPSTERGDTSRRVNRVATLDGGAVFNDFGFTDADRTIRLVFSPLSAAHEQSVTRLVQTFSRITVSGPDGLFLAAPQSYTPSDTTGALTLLVERKLNA